MKLNLLVLTLSLWSLTASAGTFADLDLDCKASGFVSDLNIRVVQQDEYGKGRNTEINYASLTSTAKVKGDHCNADRKNLSKLQFDVLTGDIKSGFSMPLSLDCYLSNLPNNKFEAVVTVDSAQNSVSLVYNEDGKLKVLPMSCKAKSYIERKSDAFGMDISS